MIAQPSDLPKPKQVRFPKLNKKLAPLRTNEFNAIAFLAAYGLQTRRNGMLFELEISVKDPATGREFQVDEEWAVTRAEHHCLSTDFIRRYMATNAAEYHPVVDWLRSIPAWDGEDHIGRFMDCLTLGAEISPEQARTLVTTWLIGAVSAPHNGFAGRPIDQGPPVLVLIGPQGIGKSRLLAKLVPDRSWVKTEQTLVTGDKDSVMALTRCWLVELGELDETMRRSSDGSSKQFLTRAEDVYRKPYGRLALHCPRRTAYIASINERRFLRDPTGNRRFLPLPVERIDLTALPAPEELWAQAYALFMEGRQWWLTPEEGKALVGLQEDFKQEDGLTQIIADLFVALPAGARPSEALRMVEIQQHLALKKIQCTAKDTGHALRATGFERMKTSKGNVWLCTFRFSEDREAPPPEPGAGQVSVQPAAAAPDDTEPFFTSLPDGEAEV